VTEPPALMAAFDTVVVIEGAAPRTGAHSTTTSAEAVAEPSFDVATPAVFGTLPQDWKVVGEVRWTLRLATWPRPVFFPPQVSVPAEIAARARAMAFQRRGGRLPRMPRAGRAILEVH
jgi:hypothetical protein